MSDEHASIRYAGPGARVSAQLIDLGILMAFALPFSYLAPHFGKYWILCYLLQLIVGGAYYPMFHTLFGQTPGKRMLHVAVRTPSTGPIGWANAVRRSGGELCLAGLHSFIVIRGWWSDAIMPGETAVNLAQSIGALPGIRFISVAANLWFWSEFLTMMFNGERRSLQDLVGRTIVVEVATTSRKRS